MQCYTKLSQKAGKWFSIVNSAALLSNGVLSVNSSDLVFKTYFLTEVILHWKVVKTNTPLKKKKRQAVLVLWPEGLSVVG